MTASMEPSGDLKRDRKRRVARIPGILTEHPGYRWMRQSHEAVHCLEYRAVDGRIRRATRASTGSLSSAAAVPGGLDRRPSPAACVRAGGDGGSAGVRLVGVPSYGGVTSGSDTSGSEHVSEPEIVIAGIGSSVPFGNVCYELYDVVRWIAFDAALSGSVELLRRYVVFAGLSAGAACLAARHERAGASERTVLFIAADTGRRCRRTPGHRCVDAVPARLREGARLSGPAPRETRGRNGLTLTWPRMSWNRAPVRRHGGGPGSAGRRGPGREA
ncbi:cysteine synthase [Streptomyces sp. NPDC090082]|uniref:cysteine synthase n=1 Tax=unclassified Streptomyces TaxID=2593676 RepID=UPI00381FD86C